MILYNKAEKSIWRKLDHIAIFIMIAGTYTPISFINVSWRNILYSWCGILYLKKPNFTNKFGFHEIFHIFILIGAIVHFFMVYLAVA